MVEFTGGMNAYELHQETSHPFRAGVFILTMGIPFPKKSILKINQWVAGILLFIFIEIWMLASFICFQGMGARKRLNEVIAIGNLL